MLLEVAISTIVLQITFAIHTTVVPIILAIRTAVVPIIFAIYTTEQCMDEKKIRTGTYNLYVKLGYKFSLSCE